MAAIHPVELCSIWSKEEVVSPFVSRRRSSSSVDLFRRPRPSLYSQVFHRTVGGDDWRHRSGPVSISKKLHRRFLTISVDVWSSRRLRGSPRIPPPLIIGLSKTRMVPIFKVRQDRSGRLRVTTASKTVSTAQGCCGGNSSPGEIRWSRECVSYALRR